jgi:hypothetical protein
MTDEDVAAVVDGVAPVVVDLVMRSTADLQRQLIATTAQIAQLVDAAKDIAVMRERLAVLETRPPHPGPAGQDGAPGAPGPPGKDGADGSPGLEFCGVFLEGQTYDPGQLVTCAGSSWHCNEPTTTRPGDGAKAWTLMVKRGRDGKDGKDGGPGPQGPAGADWQQVYDASRRR